MIIDSDEHIKETVIDNKPIDQYLLLNELGFKHYTSVNPDEHLWGDEHFISPNQQFVISRRLSLNLISGGLSEHWVIYKNGARRFTERSVKTVGDIKRFIKDNTFHWIQKKRG